MPASKTVRQCSFVHLWRASTFVKSRTLTNSAMIGGTKGGCGAVSMAREQYSNVTFVLTKVETAVGAVLSGASFTAVTVHVDGLGRALAQGRICRRVG